MHAAMRVTASDFIVHVVLNEIRNSDRKAACMYVCVGGGWVGGNQCICPPSDRQATSPLEVWPPCDVCASVMYVPL